MNLLETILSAQGGAGLQQMSSRFGLDDGQTRTAIDALLPMLAGAVSRNAATPDGLEGLLGALGSGRHQRYVDEPSALNDPDTLQDGNAILGHMFGSKDVSREVASRASAQTGIGADVLKQMLPLLAAQLRDAQPVSLLQGEFASAHRGADARRWWRVAAVLAGVSVMLGTLWMQLDTWRLQTRLNALNQAMETVYRTRFPDAKRVPQPRAMMEAALRQAGAEGAAGDSGLALLARAAAVIGNQTQVSIDGVEYRGGALELRLLAPDIGALDGLRESMAGALGQPVTLASANARAGRVEGRVRIGGAP